jgi:ribonuclease HI
MSYFDEQYKIENNVVIYADGACSQQNDGVGGWGAYIIENIGERRIYGGDSLTTNNKMEMTACIKALEELSQRSNVILYTDSKYIVDGITKWIKGWERKGWMTKDFQPVKNQDLWRKLDDLTYKHKINWQWVRGHSGNRGNEIADKLAVKGKEEQKLLIRQSISIKANG